MNKLSKRIGRQIYTARIEAEMTQAALAKRIGVSVITVSRWENGHSVPKQEHLEKLDRAIGFWA